MSFTEQDFEINSDELRDIVLSFYYNNETLSNEFLKTIKSFDTDGTFIFINTSQNINFGTNKENELIILYGIRIVFQDGSWYEEPNEKIKLLIMLLVDKFKVENNRIISQHLDDVMGLEENQSLSKIEKSDDIIERLSNAYFHIRSCRQKTVFMFFVSIIFASYFIAFGGSMLFLTLYVLPLFYCKRMLDYDKSLEELTEAFSQENDEQLLALKGIIPDED